MKVKIKKSFLVDHKIFLLIILAVLIRLIIAAFFFGPWDTESVYAVSALLKKGSLIYNDTWRYNNPPVWIWMIGVLTFIADNTGMPLSFWAKMPFIISDFGVAFCIYKISQILTKNTKTAMKLSFAYLFSPITLWVSAYQGQLESLMLFFILLSAYFLIKNSKISARNLIFGALSIGAAATIKLVPLGIMPVFLIFLFQKFLKEKETGLKILGKLGIFGILGILPVILVFMPYLSVWESGIVPHVIGYKTAWGIFGTSFILRRFGESGVSPEIATAIINFSKQQGLWIMLLSLLSYLIVFLGSFNLLSAIFMIFLTMTVFSPFLAPQYLLWVVPFWLILRIDLKSLILYNFFVIASYFILFQEWTDPGIWVFLGNLLALNDRVLFINLYSLPVLFCFGITLMLWMRIVKASVEK